MKHLFGLMIFVWLLPVAVIHAEDSAGPFSIAPFSADVTPPIGHPLQAGVGVKPVVAVVDPLLAHGFVLLGEGRPVVVCSVDWCGIGNDAHDLWRERLAQAAETTSERVLVTAIHQHDAPLVDLEAERLVAAQKTGRRTFEPAFHEAALTSVVEAIKAALPKARRVTHLGVGEAKVERVASTRRILGQDGKIEFVRGSASKLPRAKDDPEGLIDPLLKTFSFWDRDHALASISVYAIHPMSHYGQGQVSADFAGIARRRRQADDPGVMHFYANGCGGNLGAGKYNDGSPLARVELAERLYQAWKAAWQATRKVPIERLTFRSVPLTLPIKESAGFRRADLEAVLKSEASSFDEKVRVAYALSWLKRCESRKKLDIPLLDFGSAVLLLLPGEPFVEYQLFAQQQRPGAFVMTLGYGDYGPVYIPTDRAFDEGGYEPGSWSFVAPGVEAAMKDAIASGLIQQQSLTLAENGQTAFTIVTATEPSVEEHTAALWLSETLEQVTGAKFAFRKEKETDKDLPQSALRVAVNLQMKSEEWHIKTSPNQVLLEGGMPRGAIYAVCEFLETHVGVLRLDPFTEHVPKQPTLTIPALDRRGRPSFEQRFLFTGFPYAHPAPMGVNGSRWRVWNKEHIQAGPTNGDYPRGVPEGVHSLGHFVSAKEFAAEHPEYFSMDANGKRMIDDMGQRGMWIQPCVTNPDVRRIVIDRAKQFLREDAEAAKKEQRAPARMLVLSQNDNTTNLCLCPNCKAISDREGSEAGLNLDFVNHVARALKADFPDVVVQTEAYNFTLKPPATIRAESNVLVRYCDNYGLSDMTRPLADPRNAERLALLDGWLKISKQAGVWDYWRNFDSHPPGFFAPSSNVRAMVRDLQLFKERGVTYMTIEVEDFMGASLEPGPISNDLQSFMPLRAWLGLKLLDDPDRDVDALLTTFCRGYYGPAARPMRELLDLIEDRQLEVTANSSDRRRHVWLAEMCDAPFFIEAYRCLDAAVAVAANDPAMLTRVKRERIVIDSAFLWTEAAVRRSVAVRSAKGRSVERPQNSGAARPGASQSGIVDSGIGHDERSVAERKATISLPNRPDVLKRHRSDWSAYLASVFNADGLKIVTPFVETGVQLIEKLKFEDTDQDRVAVATSEADLTLDGQLTEAIWQQAQPLRLLPKDPNAANDDRSNFRFAWTSDALYVGIEQPADAASAYWDVSLMTPDRKGTQAELIAQPSGSIGAYFYQYPPEGMKAVSGRKSDSKLVTHKTDRSVTAEFRIPWTDLPAEAKAGDEFLLNIAAYPKPDSKAPTHVSSPWLIGPSPGYNPMYHSSIRLGPK